VTVRRGPTPAAEREPEPEAPERPRPVVPAKADFGRRPHSLIQSFNYAIEGVIHVLRRERNMRFHFALATVVLVLDVSRSMEARDVKPTRLGAAKRAIRLFLDRAPERLRIGMVVFAGVPQVASPPTIDHEQVSVSLDNLGDYATFGGTAIGDALSMAVDVGR